MMTKDELYMSRCLHLARIGEYYVAPNPMVGAVLVRKRSGKDEVVAEGWHQMYGGPHAEVNCINMAEAKGIDTYDDCTLYVSLEPCSHYGKTPPCAKLLIDKHIPRVVVGMTDPNPLVSGKGVSMLREAGIEVKVGVLEKECRELNKRFMSLQEKHRPYIILKWAQTEDGFIDTNRTEKEAGQQLVISNTTTKQLVHQMRAENMSIMVGTRTALLDNPRLQTTRWSGRNPIRIVTDRHHILPRTLRIFSDDSPTIVYDTDTEWKHILNDLHNRNIHSVLVEGGRQWLETIIGTGLWDEIHIEVAPISIGNGVKAPAVQLNTKETLMVGKNRLYTICKSE